VVLQYTVRELAVRVLVVVPDVVVAW